MATQSNVPVTAGSGQNIDTVTTATAGNKRGVVTIGDPSTDAGYAPVDATNGLKVDVAPSSGVGSLTETAPTTDTASSGLNGRLQRIAQRITTLIASIIAVAGDVASGVTDSGNPVKVGGLTSNTLPSVVTSGQRINGWFDRHGNMHVRDGIQTASATVWTQIHVPAANTQATKSQGAGAAGVRNVCTGLTVVLAAGATAPTAVNVQVNLIDGATGGTTYLWRATLSLPATAGETRGITRSGLWIPGTAATAMTLEFSAAGGANTIESVSFEGVTITE